MKHLLQYFNPSNPSPVPAPPVWGPSDDWVKLTIAKENDEAFLLLTLYTNGWQADSFHLSLDEAKRQAKFGYGIDENDWEECLDD